MGVGVEVTGGIVAALGTKRPVAFEGVVVGADGVVETEPVVNDGGATWGGTMVMRGTAVVSAVVVFPEGSSGCWSGCGIEVSRTG